MKYKELSQLTSEELNTKLTTAQQELTKLRFSHTINRIEKPNVLSKTRKSIARIKTIQNERKHAKK
ncbi:MAG: 50S ribosomal protein L29 [Bacteroidota bacterium]